MTRKSVDVRESGFMVVVKHRRKKPEEYGTYKNPKTGKEEPARLGLRQVRRTWNIVKSPVLRERLMCIANAMQNKKFDNLGAAQTEFAELAHGVCSGPSVAKKLGISGYESPSK